MIVLARNVLQFLADLAGLVVPSIRRRRFVEAENLFLRRELALYQGRGVKPRRIEIENSIWGEERIANELLMKLGLRVSPRTVLKSPPHRPKANGICERVIGTIRRECLDWLIPLSESYLRSILRVWVGHCNHGRPHIAPVLAGSSDCGTQGKNL